MRSDLDTEATVYILLSDAHMGCTKIIQIDDEKIDVKVPPGTRDGQRLRLKGKGNRLQGTDKRGDLYLRVAVINEAKVRDVTDSRDTSYRNRGAGARESFATTQPSRERRDTSYRNNGAGLVEAFLGIDTPRDTTYRNSGAGTQEVLGKTQSAKRNTSTFNSTESAGSHGASRRQSNRASQNNQISEPIEGLDNFIGVVRNYHAFTVRDVLERIVTTERERIENEKGLWRLGAGVAALAFGISIDGFDAGDLLAGYGFSNIGAAAHQLASKEQIEFLKKLQSEWLVLDRSPMDIRRRLGEPQGRFIGISRENRLDMFNIHQSGTRGFHLVELDYAGNIAKGFKDPQSLEVLQRSYSEDDIGLLSALLYPSTIVPLKLCRTITPEEAKKKDPYYNQLSKAGAPFRVVYSDDTEGIMYKIQIPHHSDY